MHWRRCVWQSSVVGFTALTIHINGQQLPARLKLEQHTLAQVAVEKPEQFAGWSLANLDNDTLLAFHRDLVNIDSTSGSEHDIGIYLEKQLQFLNYTVERQNVTPLDPLQTPMPAQRFNLLAHPPTHRRTRVLLTTHIDTVPPFIPYSYDPFAMHMSGRGTVDAKACIATQLFAAQSLIRSGAIAAEDLSHLFVVGEEVSGDGMLTANRLNISWETVIFGEPTEGKLASGHKGLLLLNLNAHGKAAHSGYPWLGRSATGSLIKALAALQAMELPWSEKYGNSTLNIGRINGGVAANVMAENATAQIGIRLADGDVDLVKQLLIDTVKGATMGPKDALVELEFVQGDRAYGPVDIDCDVAGFGECITVNYGTDIPHMEGTHRRYLYGPGSILVAHGKDEGLDTKSLSMAVGDYKRLILHALKL